MLKRKAGMPMQFRDRTEAVRLLAGKLTQYSNCPDVVVLGLPRGGVVVALEVARSLHAPLDVFVVHKLGVPGHEELAMGAIASGGVRVLNDRVVRALRIRAAMINEVAARELHELNRREREYRADRPVLNLRGRTVILVDDGIATGSTMRAAVAAVRQLQASRIVVAVPTAALATVRENWPEVDDFVTVMTPADFVGVGEWYVEFLQVSDEEVFDALERASRLPSPV